MNKCLLFLVWLAVVVAAIAAFNLLIGVFGLNQAIVTMAVFVIFSIYSCIRTQSEERGPHV